MRLHSVSKQLVAQLLPLTTHKRHTVRIAALQAVKVTMHQVRALRLHAPRPRTRALMCTRALHGGAM